MNDDARRTSGSGADLARAALARAREDAARRGTRPAADSSSGGASETRRRGRARRASGGGARQEDPLPFAAALSQLLEERGWRDRVAASTALDGWDALVGAEIAAHCHPVSLCDGILTISADSTAWATQLRLLAPQVLARLRRELGAAAVARIVVRGPVAPDWKHGALRVRDGRGPRDTYG
jgi:predicted nucleic acid-binding Zn ribbon protein